MPKDFHHKNVQAHRQYLDDSELAVTTAAYQQAIADYEALQLSYARAADSVPEADLKAAWGQVEAIRHQLDRLTIEQAQRILRGDTCERWLEKRRFIDRKRLERARVNAR